jgi:hypothetical protein
MQVICRRSSSNTGPPRRVFLNTTDKCPMAMDSRSLNSSTHRSKHIRRTPLLNKLQLQVTLCPRRRPVPSYLRWSQSWEVGASQLHQMAPLPQLSHLPVHTVQPPLPPLLNHARSHRTNFLKPLLHRTRTSSLHTTQTRTSSPQAPGTQMARLHKRRQNHRTASVLGAVSSILLTPRVQCSMVEGLRTQMAMVATLRLLQRMTTMNMTWAS